MDEIIVVVCVTSVVYLGKGCLLRSSLERYTILCNRGDCGGDGGSYAFGHCLFVILDAVCGMLGQL